jgi:hypothetical protein
MGNFSVLYAYSDFVHDKAIKTNYSQEDFNKEINGIKTFQKKIRKKSIIQNLYVIPNAINSSERTKKYILNEDNVEKSLYMNIFYLDMDIPDIKENDLRHHRNKQLNAIPIYKDNHSNLCSPALLFPSQKYFIRLTNEKALDKEHQQLHLKMKDEHLLDNTFIPVDTQKVVLYYTGQIPANEQDIFLDIAQEGGVHGLVKLDFKDSFPDFLKWLLPLLCLLFGFWFALSIVRHIYNKQTLTNP